MKYKIGMKIKYRCAFIKYRGKNSIPGVDIKEAIIVGVAGKGKWSDYKNSDYIVQKNELSYPVGIGKEQIIETLN